MIHLVYRGPFESSRLSFLVAAAARAHGPVKVWWLMPGSLDRDAVRPALAFLDTVAGVVDHEVLDGRWEALASTRRRLRPARAATTPLVAVGVGVLEALGRTRARTVTWCINGVPEERAMEPSLAGAALTRAAWAAHRLHRRPDLVVTVSEPMAAHVERMTGSTPTFAAPCCVDTAALRPSVPLASRGPEVVYQGSGAPWQDLDHLATVWRAVADRRSDVRFKVVSRDERCAVLAEGMGDRAEVVSAVGREAVGRALQSSRAGMLLRADHLVNRLAFPTKLGEYLACGVPVVASDLGWDVSGYLRETGCGALVAPGTGVDATADAVLRVLDGDPAPLAAAAAEGARLLSRDRWIDRLAEVLPR